MSRITKSNDSTFIRNVRNSGRDGRLYDKQNGVEVEVPPPVVLAMDIGGIRTGPICFRAHCPPQFVWDEDGVEAPRPSRDFKRGFAMHVFFKELGIREWSSNSSVTIDAVNAVIDVYDNEAAQHPGKVLFVRWAGSQRVRVGGFDVFQPKLEIVGWHERPAEFREIPIRESNYEPPLETRPAPSVSAAVRDRLEERHHTRPSSEEAAYTDRPSNRWQQSASVDLDDDIPF